MLENKETVSMTLQDILDNGVRCYQEGNLDGAAFYFESYASLDKDNSEVLHVLAQVLCSKKQYSKAINFVSRALIIEPDNSEFKFTLAESLFFIKNYAKAERVYSEIKEYYPLNTYILDRLIAIYKQQSNIIAEKRMRTLKREAEEKVDPLQSELAKTVVMAKSMIENNATEEAKLLLGSVIQLANDNLHANGLLAIISMNEGKYEDAVKYFDKIKENMVDDYYGSYAYSVDKIKGKEAALLILEEGVELIPHNQELRKQLAIHCFNFNKYQRAYKEICKINEPSIQDRQYFIIKAVSRLLAIEEKNKWFNLDALSAAADELKIVHNEYPNDEQVSFHLVKYYLNVGEIKQAYDLLCKSEFSDLNNKEWNKHPYYQAIRDRDSFFKSYLCGHEQRLRLPLDSLKNKVWKGESLAGKKVVIMREQGIGDEIIFAHNYNWIIESAEETSIFCSQRLINEFSRLFTKADFYHVKEENGTLIYPAETQHIIYSADVIIFAGDTPAYSYWETGRPLYDKVYYNIEKNRKEYWFGYLNKAVKDTNKPKVGIIWRSGSVDGLRSTHYLNEKDVVKIVSALPEVEFFNCMYVECKQELSYIQKKTGIKIHHLDDLDQKNDFGNTAAMLSCLDLVVGAYTATLVLALATGTPVVGYAADYLKEDRMLVKEAFYHNNAAHISLPVNDIEQRAIAIDGIINLIKESIAV